MQVDLPVEDGRHLGDGQLHAHVLGDLTDLNRGRGGQARIILVGHGDRRFTDTDRADVSFLVDSKNRLIRRLPDDDAGVEVS